MTLSEFERVIRAAMRNVPPKFRTVLKKENIHIHAKTKTPAVLQKHYKNGVVFGVFLGVAYTERSVFNLQTEPTRIELYKNSFEKAFKTRREMERQIVLTVLHEIGHYFGFSEKDLRRHRL